MKWRKEMRVAQALDEPLSLEILSTIRKNKPASYIGFDRQHRPLYVDRVGMLNEPAIRAAGIEMDTLVKYHIQEMEVRSGALEEVLEFSSFRVRS